MVCEAGVGLTAVGLSGKIHTHTHERANRMTKTEAINYIRSEMQMVLDDDYPDRMESLVEELVDQGYGEEAAEELIFDTQEWV